MTRRFTFVLGITFLAVGILGFVPGITTPGHPHEHITVDAGYGYLLGLFPVNVLHNLVHVVVGAAAVYAARDDRHARILCQVLAVFYGVLAVMGLIPFANTTFGLIPIFGHDVWLHAFTALAAAYFGFIRHEAPRGRPQQPHAA